MSIKARILAAERFTRAKEDVVAIVLRGGTHRGLGVAKDPGGDLVVHQTENEDAADFIVRAMAEARAAGCRQIVVRPESVV